MQILLLVIAIAQAAAPDAAEQARILDRMRTYGAAYRRPDVTYTQELTIFQKRSGKWRRRWSNVSQRVAHDSREYLCCRLGPNGKPIPNQWVGTWYMPGHGTFPWDATKAAVAWNRGDVVRGRRVAVFDYDVARQDSRFIMANFSDKSVIPRSDGGEYSGPVTDPRGSVILPYAGSVWVDPCTGAIWRHSLRSSEYPAVSPLLSQFEVVDYDEVALGEATHLLKVGMLFWSVAKHVADRVEFVYRDYRKFEADSSITFYDVDSTVTYPNRRP